MRKSISSSLLIVFISILLFSCKSKKNLVKPVAAVSSESSVSSKSALLKNVQASQTNFSTLSLKAKADLAMDKNSFNATFNIRMQKDKVIWVSVTAIAGIEVARLLITPDTIKIINRLEKTYSLKPFNFIYQFTSKQVNFTTLQSILLGDYVPEFINNDSNLESAPDQFILSGIANGLTYKTIINKDFDVLEDDFKDEKAGQELLANYSDYVQVESNHLPGKVAIQSKVNNRSVTINLQYNQFDLNKPVDFPFNIPERFSVKN